MIPPTEWIYLPNPTAAVQSKVYHVANCNGRLSDKQRMPVTTELLSLLDKLGMTLCKTCSLRYEKELKLAEHAMVIEKFGIAALEVPPEFELRVYWHRPVGQPIEIWSSKKGNPI